MNQFDLYANANPQSKKAYPLFVDIQHNLLEALNSRVVIPLTKASPQQNLPDSLCPILDIEGNHYYLLTHQVTSVSKSYLKKKVGSVLLNRTEIINALDFLVSGI